jgi:hypothetical protein
MYSFSLMFIYQALPFLRGIHEPCTEAPELKACHEKLMWGFPGCSCALRAACSSAATARAASCPAATSDSTCQPCASCQPYPGRQPYASWQPCPSSPSADTASAGAPQLITCLLYLAVPDVGTSPVIVVVYTCLQSQCSAARAPISMIDSQRDDAIYVAAGEPKPCASSARASSAATAARRGSLPCPARQPCQSSHAGSAASAAGKPK